MRTAILAMGAVVWLAAADQASATLPPSKRYLARVLKYDEASDTFTYRSSVAGTQGRYRPGGEDSYGGNRLRQYRYLGPQRQGGIYYGIQIHNLQQPRDIRDYQFRYNGRR